MNIKVYEDLYEALKKYNDELPENYGNEVYDDVVKLPYTLDNSFPLTIFQEINNVSNSRFMSPIERISTVGYTLAVYSTDKGQITNKKIARELAEQLDNFLTLCGLTRISYNSNRLDNGVYYIILTYTGNLYENKSILI